MSNADEGDWDRSAPWVYETAAPAWVNQLGADIPEHRLRGPGIELDPEDQYYPSEDDFDDDLASPLDDNGYPAPFNGGYDAPRRPAGDYGARPGRPGEQRSSRGYAADEDRYRDHRDHTTVDPDDELASRRWRRTQPDPEFERRPRRRDAGPFDDDRLPDRDPRYRPRPGEPAGWYPPDRDHRVTNGPSGYADQPATGRARVPQPQIDGVWPDTDRDDLVLDDRALARNPWVLGRDDRYPNDVHPDDRYDDDRYDTVDPDGYDDAAGQYPADRRPADLQRRAELERRPDLERRSVQDPRGRAPQSQQRSDRGSGLRRDPAADARGPARPGRNPAAQPRNPAAQSRNPAGQPRDGAGWQPAGPAVRRPDRPTDDDSAAPRIVGTTAPTAIPRVVGRSEPSAAPRIISRTAPPPAPRVISAVAPTATPKPATAPGAPPVAPDGTAAVGYPGGARPRPANPPARPGGASRPGDARPDGTSPADARRSGAGAAEARAEVVIPAEIWSAEQWSAEMPPVPDRIPVAERQAPLAVAAEAPRVNDALVDAIAPEDLLPTTLMPGPEPVEEQPPPEPEPELEPEPDPGAVAEEALAAIRWRLDGGTLREVVDDTEALRALGAMLDKPLSVSTDNVARARLLCLRAEVFRLLDELGMAAAASRLALAHAETAADPHAIVVAQGELAHVLRLRGNYDEADRLFEEAASAEVPQRLRCLVHENAGRSCFDQGRHMEALDHFTRAIRLGDPADLDLVERIDVALEAVYIRLLRDGWGPYPRLRREILGTAPPEERDRPPLTAAPAASPDQRPVPQPAPAQRRVAAPAPAPAAAQQSAPTPAPVSASVPAPAPRLPSIPTPVRRPAPVSASVSASVPAPAPSPAPVPFAAPVPSPAPVPAPRAAAVPASNPGPASVPAAAPVPAPAPRPPAVPAAAPVPAPAPRPPAVPAAAPAKARVPVPPPMPMRAPQPAGTPDQAHAPQPIATARPMPTARPAPATRPAPTVRPAPSTEPTPVPQPAAVPHPAPLYPSPPPRDPAGRPAESDPAAQQPRAGRFEPIQVFPATPPEPVAPPVQQTRPARAAEAFFPDAIAHPADPIAATDA